MSIKTLLIISLLCISFQFFSKNSPVIQLNKNNFKEKVLNSSKLWLILFYAPWCGHCKAFHPEFEKVAKLAEDSYGIGAVNCEDEKDFCSEYNIDGFPTVLFFGKDKQKREEYEGERDAEEIMKFLSKKARKRYRKKKNHKTKSESDL